MKIEGDTPLSGNIVENPEEYDEVNDNENENDDVGQIGSHEKILHLPRGYKVWIKLCIAFAISFLLFAISLPLALFYNNSYLFIPTGLGCLGFLACFCFVTCFNGFIVVNPNEAIVYQYFGRYLGTIKDNGYFYGYPCAKSTKVSLRSNQYNGNRLLVNERDGNPVELGIIVVWRIGDTAKAVFDVVGYEYFIHTQSESAIRYIGCKYPYEPTKPNEVSLRGGQEIINKELKKELEKRVKISGIIIEDARVTEISYGRQVAELMLQKQASNSAVFAKDAIVKGAARSIMDSLKEFEQKGCEFTKEQETKFISTLMKTICMNSDISKAINS